MSAELIAVGGELTGARFPLGTADFTIGRELTATLAIADQAVSWRHCRVRHADGRYELTDLRSGQGTYVNGLRTAAHWLEDGDQISIGDTDLLFRTGATPALPDQSRPALLRACSLLFVFRALAEAHTEGNTGPLAKTVLRILGDFIPCEDGAVLLAAGAAKLRARAAEHGHELARIAETVCLDGSYASAPERKIAVALYARSQLAGMLMVKVSPAAAADLAEQLDLLSAISLLASAAIEGVHEVESLRIENTLLQERLGTTEGSLLGESPAMRRLSQMIEHVARQDATVLILGESGTGKELVARALHAQSPRHRKPFVAINCAALTETLLESELFGHEKGAFTGAVAQKKGKLEVAEGGTVFLDEIGELAAGLQAKLLRVLQQREFERVGGTRTISLDVRVVTATNRDLAAEAKRGAFREDLYHRLNVIALRTPPLRERGADILLLAERFLARAAVRCKRRVTGFAPEASRLLAAYAWPGNVRELENAIERAVVLGESGIVLPEDLPETVLEGTALEAEAGGFQATVGGAKRESIVRAWQQAHGDYKVAAQMLGLHPNSLLRLVRNLGLREMLRVRGA